jgi:hypothetical protein
MPAFIKNNKVVGGIVVLVLLALCYWAFFSGGGSGAPLSSTSTAASPSSQDLLVALSNLQTIQLNDAVFTDPVFESLTDFGVTIPPQTPGRSNPFAPISPSSPTTSGTPVITLPATR